MRQLRYMRVPPWVVCVFLWGIPQLQSGACSVTTDLIKRVNVRTATTTTTTRTRKNPVKKSPVEKGRFRLAESDCITNGLIYQNQPVVCDCCHK